MQVQLHTSYNVKAPSALPIELSPRSIALIPRDELPSLKTYHGVFWSVKPWLNIARRCPENTIEHNVLVKRCHHGVLSGGSAMQWRGAMPLAGSRCCAQAALRLKTRQHLQATEFCWQLPIAVMITRHSNDANG